MEPVLPTIHLNGTSAEALALQYDNARQAVNLAIRTLQDACPNQRDYYMRAPEVWRAAWTEHELRINKLVTVRDQLQALAEHCADQVKP